MQINCRLFLVSVTRDGNPRAIRAARSPPLKQETRTTRRQASKIRSQTQDDPIGGVELDSNVDRCVSCSTVKWKKKVKKKRKRQREEERKEDDVEEEERGARWGATPTPGKFENGVHRVTFPLFGREESDVWLRARRANTVPFVATNWKKGDPKKTGSFFPLRGSGASSTWPAGSCSFTSHGDLRSDLEFLPPTTPPPPPHRTAQQRNETRKLIAD